MKMKQILFLCIPWMIINQTSAASLSCGYGCEYTLVNGLLTVIGTKENATIDDLMFYDQDDIENIVVKGSIKTVGYRAFKEMDNVQTVDLSQSQIENSGHDSFSVIRNATTILLPNTLKTIGNNSFQTSGYTHIDIPESVTKIEGAAFHRLTNLETLRLPDGVVDNIDSLAFYMATPTIYCSASKAATCESHKSTWYYNKAVEIYPDYTYDKESGKYTFYCEKSDTACQNSKNKISLLFDDKYINNSEPISYIKEGDLYIIDGQKFTSLPNLPSYTKENGYYLSNGKKYSSLGSLIKGIEMKRIYTVEEASDALGKENKNTFSIRYR